MNELQAKIANYLSVGAATLDHNEYVTRLLEDCEMEISRLIEKCDRQAMILRRLTPENNPGTYFIHSDGGEKNDNGMPERLYVVPSYGCDWSQVYRRTDNFVGPEW